MRNNPSAWEVILAVNAKAAAMLNLPSDFRVDMSRVRSIRAKWEDAAIAYKEETGLDVYEALREHEANLRSRTYAPQLYVNRR